jgi:hypothetical protein
MKKGKGEGDGALPYEKTNRTPHPSAESTIHHPSQLNMAERTKDTSLPPRPEVLDVSSTPPYAIYQGDHGLRLEWEEGLSSLRIPAILQPRDISLKHDKRKEHYHYYYNSYHHSPFVLFRLSANCSFRHQNAVLAGCPKRRNLGVPTTCTASAAAAPRSMPWHHRGVCCL